MYVLESLFSDPAREQPAISSRKQPVNSLSSLNNIVSHVLLCLWLVPSHLTCLLSTWEQMICWVIACREQFNGLRSPTPTVSSPAVPTNTNLKVLRRRHKRLQLLYWLHQPLHQMSSSGTCSHCHIVNSVYHPHWYICALLQMPLAGYTNHYTRRAHLVSTETLVAGMSNH